MCSAEYVVLLCRICRESCSELDSVLSPYSQGLSIVLFCAVCCALLWNLLGSFADYIGLFGKICRGLSQQIGFNTFSSAARCGCMRERTEE